MVGRLRLYGICYPALPWGGSDAPMGDTNQRPSRGIGYIKDLTSFSAFDWEKGQTRSLTWKKHYPLTSHTSSGACCKVTSLLLLLLLLWVYQ